MKKTGNIQASVEVHKKRCENMENNRTPEFMRLFTLPLNPGEWSADDIQNIKQAINKQKIYLTDSYFGYKANEYEDEEGLWCDFFIIRLKNTRIMKKRVFDYGSRYSKKTYNAIVLDDKLYTLKWNPPYRDWETDRKSVV